VIINEDFGRAASLPCLVVIRLAYKQA